MEFHATLGDLLSPNTLNIEELIRLDIKLSSSDGSALLEAIKREPENYVARMVFADWIQENCG